MIASICINLHETEQEWFPSTLTKDASMTIQTQKKKYIFILVYVYQFKQDGNPKMRTGRARVVPRNTMQPAREKERDREGENSRGLNENNWRKWMNSSVETAASGDREAKTRESGPGQRAAEKPSRGKTWKWRERRENPWKSSRTIKTKRKREKKKINKRRKSNPRGMENVEKIQRDGAY